MRTAVFLCFILFAGCAKNENNCTPSSQSYTFQSNKSIDTSAHTVSLVNGSQTVFKFQYNYEQCEGVVGAAVSREIYFELPSATQNDFSYSNESLTNANMLVYLIAPISPSLRIQKPVQGSIRGTQISSTKWHITASLNTGTEIINFEEDFLKIE
jgi:hypothetical protein